MPPLPLPQAGAEPSPYTFVKDMQLGFHVGPLTTGPDAVSQGNKCSLCVKVSQPQILTCYSKSSIPGFKIHLYHTYKGTQIFVL